MTDEEPLEMEKARGATCLGFGNESEVILEGVSEEVDGVGEGETG